jgi:hypothetical protein
MLHANLGMLSLFVGTPCEDEDEVREESRDPRALLRVPDPFRKERRGRKERPSQGPAPLRAHLGMPSMRFETPNEERTTPTVKRESPRATCGVATMPHSLSCPYSGQRDGSISVIMTLGRAEGARAAPPRPSW